MTRYCKQCDKDFASDIKKCPDCNAKLQKKYTAEELEQIRKEEETAIVTTLFM